MRHLQSPESLAITWSIILADQLGREKMPASDIAGKDTLAKAPAWPVPVVVNAEPAKPSLQVEPVVGSPLVFQVQMSNPWIDRKSAFAWRRCIMCITSDSPSSGRC